MLHEAGRHVSKDASSELRQHGLLGAAATLVGTLADVPPDKAMCTPGLERTIAVTLLSGPLRSFNTYRAQHEPRVDSQGTQRPKSTRRPSATVMTTLPSRDENEHGSAPAAPCDARSCRSASNLVLVSGNEQWRVRVLTSKPEKRTRRTKRALEKQKLRPRTRAEDRERKIWGQGRTQPHGRRRQVGEHWGCQGAN